MCVCVHQAAKLGAKRKEEASQGWFGGWFGGGGKKKEEKKNQGSDAEDMRKFNSSSTPWGRPVYTLQTPCSRHCIVQQQPKLGILV